jgi:aldehyde dehydrogenase (NAD+)
MTPQAHTLDQISDSVRSLRHGFEGGLTRPLSWRRAQLDGLQRMLLECGEEFELALRQDLGKSGTEAQLTEIGFLVGEISDTQRHLAAWTRPRKVSVPLGLQPASARVRAEPLGVALIIAPWNYPLMLALSPLVGALAAGNAAVLKPSELAPATAEVIARRLPEYVDRRAVTVVNGGVDAATALLAERFDHIFYTGNGRVGRVVARAAAEHLTPVTLELGGKSPVYIDSSVALPEAAKRIAWAKFLNAGQTCVAPDYVLGTPPVLNALGPLLATAIYELYGNAAEHNPDYGRIVNDAHFERLTGYLNDGTVLSGGRSDAAMRYIEPTVLGGVDRDSGVMTDEIFGPILPLIEVSGLSDAIDFVVGRDKPLSAYVFSHESEALRRWELETSSGSLCFGAPILQLSVPNLPFGGVGESGTGSYHGHRSFLTFSHEKSIFAKPLHPDTLAYTVMPPFTKTKDTIVRKLLAKLR